MAHIRLRINNKEYELEGSEEFIARMEPKLTNFLEKHLEEQVHPPAQHERTTDVQALAPATGSADDAYVKGFLERYNNFNDLMAGKQ
jgi:hypothetical protein